jgi:predicted lysophospholipase L1 biosynthesis ABC-type transport system permease subunit
VLCRRFAAILPTSFSNCDSLERVKRFLIILGVILLVLGVVGLVHPSFSYHKQEEVAKIGSFKATVDEEKTVQIPAAVSIVLLVSGIGLVLLGPRIK